MGAYWAREVRAFWKKKKRGAYGGRRGGGAHMGYARLTAAWVQITEAVTVCPACVTPQVSVRDTHTHAHTTANDQLDKYELTSS